MKISAKDYVRPIKKEKHMKFNKSIIKGVEIKRCRNTPYDYKAHVHNELSLGYIIEGTTDLSLSDRTIHYETGNGVIIPPFTTHRCTPKDVNHWAYVMLFIDPDYYGDVIRFGQTRKLTGNAVQKLMDFIEQLLAKKNPDILENVLIELLIEFGDESNFNTIATKASDIQFIHDYLIESVYDTITLDKLEKISGLNKFTLIRNFKKLYTTTPAAFHLQCRVSEAKKLLSNGNNVFEICGELNFYDQAHLIREFKKMYGITPAAYMERL